MPSDQPPVLPRALDEASAPGEQPPPEPELGTDTDVAEAPSADEVTGETNEVTGETNEAEALVAAAAALETVELLNSTSKRRRGRLSNKQRVALGRALARAPIRSELVATPPPFPIVLSIRVHGREAPFIAHLVGHDRLRVNPKDPWSAAVTSSARDIVVGMRLYTDLERSFAAELRKEYRLPDDAPQPGSRP